MHYGRKYNVCTSSKLALELWSISIDSDRPVSCWTSNNLMLTFYTTLLLFPVAQMTHHTPQHQQQMPPTCLHLDTAACVLLLALWFIGGLITGGAWALQMGVRSQVTTGNESAHVDVVGKDVVTDELAEEQDQVRELHAFTFVPRLRCIGERGIWII